MFSVMWDTLAFDQMHPILLWHTHRRAELAVALATLTRELAARADTWGESRTGPFRLAFVGQVAVLFRVDMDDHVAEIVEVRLGPDRPPG